MVEAARFVAVAPAVVEVVAVVVLSAGLLPKRELVAAGAVVVDVPAAAVVDAGAAVELAAAAEVAAGVAPPNRPPLAGADVEAGVDVAGLAPNRLLVAAGAAEVVAVDAGADEAAAPPKRLLPVLLLPDVAAANGLAAAVVAGAAAVVAAGFAPKRLDVVLGAVVAGCDVAAEAPPKRPPPVAAGAASGFLPNRPPALELLSFAADANSEEPLAAGVAAGVAELVFPNMPPAEGCAAGVLVLPKRPPCLGACVCAWPKGDAAAWAGCEAGCVVLEVAGAPAGVVDPRPPNRPDGLAGVA